MKRIIPNVPNFSKIPAKIMDPATGASTCALGSHKCSMNMGALAKNAVNRDILHQKFTLGDIFVWIIEKSCIVVVFITIFNNSGSEAVTV